MESRTVLDISNGFMIPVSYIYINFSLKHLDKHLPHFHRTYMTLWSKPQ